MLAQRPQYVTNPPTKAEWLSSPPHPNLRGGATLRGEVVATNIRHLVVRTQHQSGDIVRVGVKRSRIVALRDSRTTLSDHAARAIDHRDHFSVELGQLVEIDITDEELFALGLRTVPRRKS